MFTVGVVATTIMWSLGVAALMPSAAQAAECTVTAGEMIKTSGANHPDIWIVNADLTRSYFMSGDVFKSWNADNNYSKYYTTVTSACMSSLSATGVALARPGTLLFQEMNADQLYVAVPGGKLQKISDAAAMALYGSKYKTMANTGGKLLKVDNASWVLLNKAVATAAELTEAVPHEGMLVSNGGKYYAVGAGKVLSEVTDTGLTANRYKTTNAYALAATTGFTMGTAVSAYDATLAARVTGDTGSTVVTTGGTVVVALAANTPAAGYIAKGAYNAEFTKVTVQNTSSASVRVDKIVVKRDGLGVDADITAVRLYDGAKQVGSDQAINTNTHLATFNNLNFDVAAGVTKTLTIKADTYSSASGTNDYLSVTTVELEGAGTVSAALPLAGYAMQYHAVTPAVVDVDSLASPAADAFISGATDQQLACYNFDVNAGEGVDLKSMTLTNAGTVANDDLSNFVLKEGSLVVGSTAGNFESNGTVTLDLNSKPFHIDASKSKDLCLYADIKGGIKDSLGKTINLQIAQYKDVVVTGESSKAQIIVTNDNAATFTALSSPTTGNHTISQGTLTITRNTATLPVSTALIDGVAHNKLAAYKFTAGSTEGATVTRLRLTVSGSGVSSTDLSNFELYTYDEATGLETAVGSSQSVSGSYVTFEDTNEGLFSVAKSKNTVVHVYADVNTAAAWTGTVANVFIGTGTNTDLIVKAKGSASGEYLNPSDISLSSVGAAHSTVTLFSNSNSGTMTVSLDNNSPAATSIAKGTNDYDFAHVKLYAASEDMNVTALTLRAFEDSDTGVTDAIETADSAITNVRVYDMSGTTPVQLGTAVAAPAAGVSTFSFNLNVPKDSYKLLKVVADVPTDASASYIKFAVVSATVDSDLTTTGASSGQDIVETGSATGKTMTVAAPTVTITWGAGTTNNVVLNASSQTLGTLQLTGGAYEDVNVTTVKVEVSSSTLATFASGDSSANSDLSNFMLVGTDGTQYGTTKNLTNGQPDYVQFTGLTNLKVTKGTTKIVYVKADVAGNTGTSYYVGNTATANVAGSGAISGTAATIAGTGNGWLNSINSTATLTFALSASNPSAHVVAVGASGTGTEETLLTLSADSLYEDVDITKLVFNVLGATGDNVKYDFTDNGLKLYHKIGSGAETLVGSASVVSSTDAYLAIGYTATFNMAAGVLHIGKSTDDTLLVKGVFKGTEAGLTAATSPYVKLGDGTNGHDTSYVEAKGALSGTSLTAFNGSTALALASNDAVVYKGYPTFTYVNPGSTLYNGNDNTLYSFKVKANGAPVALKQLRFGLLVTDNVGTANNSYDLETFKFYKNGADVSSDVLVLDWKGASLEGSVTSATVFPSGTAKYFYVVWPTTAEEVIDAGTENTYAISATLTGFTTPADDDNVRVRLENTDAGAELTQSGGTYYLSPQKASGNYTNLLALDDSTLDGTVFSTTTASLLWSDRSATSHSAATGTISGGAASSSGDWFNGYLLKDGPTSWATLTN